MILKYKFVKSIIEMLNKMVLCMYFIYKDFRVV